MLEIKENVKQYKVFLAMMSLVDYSLVSIYKNKVIVLGCLQVSQQIDASHSAGVKCAGIFWAGCVVCCAARGHTRVISSTRMFRSRIVQRMSSFTSNLYQMTIRLHLRESKPIRGHCCYLCNKYMA